MAGKIGVLTFHKCINYGSYWQARCLIEGLQSRGYEAELLDHHCNCVAWAEARCAFQPMLPARTRRQDMRAYSAKTRKFAQAIKRLPQSPRFNLHEPDSVSGYDTILVGSDEVWNLAHPWYGGKEIFYGAGLNPRRLVSYAASFGSYSCHWGIDEYWANQLKRFDALSVRDENSYWLVHGSTSIDAPIVLDPCLQFPQPAMRDRSTGGYVLLYGHTFPAWMREQVRRWSNARNLTLVSIGYRNDWADEQLIAASPEDFAERMAAADAVVTNFFHGCVFALLNGKPFVTTTTDYRLHKIRDLANLLGVHDRVLDEASEFRLLADLLETPVQPQVAGRISSRRERSQDYLDAALA